jgi:hypothetical protein
MEGWSRADSVDYLVLKAGMSRAGFELRAVAAPRRNPWFYVSQTLGAIGELLVEPGPFTDVRSRNIVTRLESVPATLANAQLNLTESVGQFADATIEELQHAPAMMASVDSLLAPRLTSAWRTRFHIGMNKAALALSEFRTWLSARRGSMAGKFQIGQSGYEEFLREITVSPFTCKTALEVGAVEYRRASRLEDSLKAAHSSRAEPGMAPSIDTQIALEKQKEETVRRFLRTRDLLSIDPSVGSYRYLPVPEYLEPFGDFLELDDFSGPSRPGSAGIRYIRAPRKNLGFFEKVEATEPSPLIIHEGIPGHFYQLCLGWTNPRIVRRQYVDSGPIEGIGFYAEEMMMEHGFFDDTPRSMEVIARFMKLRALRVEVDIKLAAGDLTIEQAADLLSRGVPMSLESARNEAISFAMNPGQASSYQLGKSLILEFLRDARRVMGAKFSLRALHDYLWANGNVPIELLRWEYLGLDDWTRMLFR